MLKVTFINVGYGDSILVELRTASSLFVMLVDGGKPGRSGYDGYPQRIRAVDYLAKTGIKHPMARSCNGMNSQFMIC